MKITTCKKLRKTNSSCGFRKKNNNIPCLSQEIIFNILTRVSAEFLHNVVRFVSRSWTTSIISTPHFVQTHLSRSTLSFFFKNYINIPLVDSSPFMLRQPQCLFRDCCFKPEFVRCLIDSTDGFILFTKTPEPYQYLYLANPITKQHLSTLHLPTNSGFLVTANIAYIAPTQEIKIICRFQAQTSNTLPTHSIVSTIRGNNNDMSWKRLEQHDFDLAHFSFSTGSLVIYWCWYELHRYWAIDLDDESVHSYNFPFIHCTPGPAYVIPMGRDLYVAFKFYRALSPDELVIWKLKDVRRCEWVEVFRITTDHFGLSKRVNSKYHAWFDKEKILIYSTSDSDPFKRSYIAFDFIRRRKWDLAPFDFFDNIFSIQSYITSLVSF